MIDIKAGPMIYHIMLSSNSNADISVKYPSIQRVLKTLDSNINIPSFDQVPKSSSARMTCLSLTKYTRRIASRSSLTFNTSPHKGNESFFDDLIIFEFDTSKHDVCASFTKLVHGFADESSIYTAFGSELLSLISADISLTGLNHSVSYPGAYPLHYISNITMSKYGTKKFMNALIESYRKVGATVLHTSHGVFFFLNYDLEDIKDIRSKSYKITKMYHSLLKK